jgi:hypothetical protein
MKYGKLTFIKEQYRKKYSNRAVTKFAMFRCDCGNEKVINLSNVRRGLVKSCGCITKTRNGMSKTKLYQCYQHIKHRCYNPNDINYKNYGGRGILMFETWRDDFGSFYTWALNNGYKDGLTIDRVDVNGNYEPSNCKWSTMKEQQNNRTNNRIVEFKGVKKTITAWAEQYGMSYRNLHYRLKSGYTIQEALETKGRLPRSIR